MMITYREIQNVNSTKHNVYNHGLLVGAIKQDGTFWYYHPKGAKRDKCGNLMTSVAAVKKSLTET